MPVQGVGYASSMCIYGLGGRMGNSGKERVHTILIMNFQLCQLKSKVLFAYALCESLKS